MTHDHTLDAGPGTHGSEPDAQGLNPWTAPTLVRLDADAAEGDVYGAFDGFGFS
jgi:hypothetical protein